MLRAELSGAPAAAEALPSHAIQLDTCPASHRRITLLMLPPGQQSEHAQFHYDVKPRQWLALTCHQWLAHK